MATNDNNVFNFIDEALGNNPENNIVIPQSAQKSFRMDKKPLKLQSNKASSKSININQQLKQEVAVPPKPKTVITTPKEVINDVEHYMDSNGFNHDNIGGDSDMFTVIPPSQEPIKADYDPEVVSKEDVLAFDYFPDISLDEISVNQTQHTKETAKAAVEKQQQIAKSQTEEELEKTRGSIGFVLSIAGLFLFFLTIPAIIISRSEMKRGRKRAKAGFIIGIIGFLLFLVEAALLVFLIMKFGAFM